MIYSCLRLARQARPRQRNGKQDSSNDDDDYNEETNKVAIIIAADVIVFTLQLSSGCFLCCKTLQNNYA